MRKFPVSEDLIRGAVARSENLGSAGNRVLSEVIPLMYGDKKREAQMPIESFAPTGYREGFIAPADIWGALRVSPRTDTERYIRNSISGGSS